MKRLKKIFAAILIAVISIVGTIETVNAAPATLTVGPATDLDPYVAGTRFAKMTIVGGGYAYCTDITKLTTENVTVKLVGEKDAGFTYILENGYPQKKITGNDNYDYYITQTALWWYLDETTGSNNLSVNFKNGGSDDYNLRSHIISLKNGAINAKKTGYKKPSISLNADSSKLTLTADKKYYETVVTPTTNNVTGEYTINLDSAPEGTVITDLSNNIKTTFKVGEKFKVRIPMNKVATTPTSIKLTVNASGTYNKAYEYKADNTALQNVIASVLYPVTEKVSASLTLSVSTTKVTILKVDKETDKILSGATLVVKDKDGNIIEEITSDEDGYVITGLPNGEYTVEETAAPKGYILNDKKVSFTIDDNNVDLTVKVYDEKATCENGGITEGCEVVSVPQTSTTTIIMYVLGTLILVSGIGYVIYNAKKQR